MANEMAAFVGKFDFVESCGLDIYLRSLGVGLILRKVMNVSTPSIEISYDRSTKIGSFKMSSIFHTHELKFKLNEVVGGDETLDARPCQTTVSCGKNEMVMKQIVDQGFGSDVTVTLEKHGNDTLKLTHNAGDGKYICFFVFKPSSVPHGGIAR